MVSKQEQVSLFAFVFRKVKMKKYHKVFFECVMKPKNAKEIMKLRNINDLSNTKKHLKEAVEDGFLETWTEKGVRYWYVSDGILKRFIIEAKMNIKEFRNIPKKQLIMMFDLSLKFNKNGLVKSRKMIYEGFKETDR